MRRVPKENRSLSQSEPSSARNVAILKALANPQRLRMAWVLSQSDHTVNVLANLLGLKQSFTSQQLGILRASGIVEGARFGGGVRYKLVEPKAKSLIRCLAQGSNSATARKRPSC